MVVEKTGPGLAPHSPRGGRGEGWRPPDSHQAGVARTPPLPPPAPPGHQHGPDTGDHRGLPAQQLSSAHLGGLSREHRPPLLIRGGARGK